MDLSQPETLQDRNEPVAALLGHRHRGHRGGPDWRRLVVRMHQRFYNANAFGTHFGGSLYAMCDPHYALLLLPLLGPDYVVRDRAASIDFLQPARGTVSAVFDWSDEQLAEIRSLARDGRKVRPERTVDVLNDAGEAVARVHKTLHVRLARCTGR